MKFFSKSRVSLSYFRFFASMCFLSFKFGRIGKGKGKFVDLVTCDIWLEISDPELHRTSACTTVSIFLLFANILRNILVFCLTIIHFKPTKYFNSDLYIDLIGQICASDLFRASAFHLCSREESGAKYALPLSSWHGGFCRQLGGSAHPLRDRRSRAADRAFTFHLLGGLRNGLRYASKRLCSNKRGTSNLEQLSVYLPCPRAGPPQLQW